MTTTGDASNRPLDSEIPRPNYYHVEHVMGTVFEITVYDKLLSEVSFRKITERISIEWNKIDFLFSTYKEDSLLSKYRQGLISDKELPQEFKEVYDLCHLACVKSNGYFNPWRMPGGYDPTGLVKGWSLETVIPYFLDANVKCFMINAGGDIKTYGLPKNQDSWQIGIQHPWDINSLACVISTLDSVATSGDYQRPGQLIDPSTMAPTKVVASVTVTGPNLALADAYATGLAVAGIENMEWIYDIDGYEAYVLGLNGEEIKTDNLNILENE